MAKTKKHSKVKRVRVAKVVAPAPDVRIVEVEVTADPVALAELEPTETVAPEKQSGILDWLKGIWG